MAEIVSDQDIRSGDPVIEGTRISVFDVKRRVIDEGEDPHVVAGEYDVSIADLFRALTYYYDNRSALGSAEMGHEERRADGERRTSELLETDDEHAATGEQAD